MLDKNYMKTVLKTWWDLYVEYNKKLNNAYLPQPVRKIYEDQAAEVKAIAQAWESIFFGYGYYIIHLDAGEIEVVERND